MKDAAWTGFLAAVLIGLAVGGVLVYRDYAEVSEPPQPLNDKGSVFLYFDRPGLPATVDVVVRDSVLELQVEVDKSVTAADVRYFLVLTGNGSATGPTQDGCPSGLTGTTPMQCHQTVLDAAITSGAPELPKDALVISGRAARSEAGLRAEVAVDTGRAFSQTDGKRTYFGLPAIGTSYVTPAERRTAAFDLGEGKGFVPERLTVGVDYGDLAVTNRVENVSPEPWVAGSLFWFEEDASALKGRGALVDAIAEDDEQRTLFLVGLYVGLATAFVPLLLPALWRSGQRLRRRKA